MKDINRVARERYDLKVELQVVEESMWERGT